MKWISNLLLWLILVSCANLPATESPVTVVDTKIVPTGTPMPPTTVPPTVPSLAPTITFTPAAPCDPFTADYCIKDGLFILRRPIHPPANDLIDPVYGYGSTADGTRDPHHGVEFSNPSGTPVYAAADGKVIFAGPDQAVIYSPWSNFYGNVVVIEHDNHLFTLYAHLSRIDVRVGQAVFAGDQIGEVGSTGGAIGSHLHFEVRRGDAEDYFATQNPELWLIPASDENGIPFGTLMISIIDSGGTLIPNENFTIGYYPDPSQSPVRVYYAISYSADLLNGEENAVLGELSAGHYRIAVEMNGHILERWVEVESGKLTQAVLVVE